MLEEKQQFKQLIENSRHILVVFNNQENTDAIAAALALKNFLEKDKKSVDIVCNNFVPSKKLNFLNDIEKIKNDLNHLQKLIIKVDLKNTKVDTLSYDIKDDWLSIYITPKQGIITKNELRTAQSSYKYDLIITLDTHNLESLGSIFLNNTDLFYRTNIINVDCHGQNERYGQLNYIDLNSTSISEIVYQLSKNLWEHNINPENATTILAGMIAGTHSFKTTNVTPLTLQIASELINQGAERERIIQNLYRTRSLATLRLWGMALSKLKIENEVHLAYCTITKEDFLNSGGSKNDLKDIITELINNSPEIDLTLLIYEDTEGTENSTRAILHSKKGHDTQKILRKFNPNGTTHEARIEVKENIVIAEKIIFEEIKKSLK